MCVLLLYVLVVKVVAVGFLGCECLLVVFWLFLCCVFLLYSQSPSVDVCVLGGTLNNKHHGVACFLSSSFCGFIYKIWFPVLLSSSSFFFWFFFNVVTLI